MIYSFIGIVTSIFLSHTILKEVYPTEYNMFLYVLGYNSLYVFSKFQIFFNKHYKPYEKHLLPFYANYILPFAERLGILEKTVNKEIKLIKNGHLQRFFIKNELEFLKRLKETLVNDYDIIIYTDFSSVSNVNDCSNVNDGSNVNETKTDKIHKVVYSDIPEHLDYKPVQFHFILCELVIGENTYKLDFTPQNYNYFVDGNKICKKFLLYFLKEHHHDIFDKHINDINNDKYLLKIIDHNVNMIDLTPDKALVIKENTCDIVDYLEKKIVNENLSYPDFCTKDVGKSISHNTCDNTTTTQSNLDDSYVKI